MAFLMSPACKSWDLIVMGGLEYTSFVNAILRSIVEAKACWRAILTCYMKNWMQKYKDKWPLDHLLWKRHAHSLMKWSISFLNALCTSMAIKIKWCLSWNRLYLQFLTMALNSPSAPTSRVMTFKAIVSHIRWVTTTLTMRTWFFWVM